MDELTRFLCPSCRQVTTFRPGLLEALFGDTQPQGPFYSYVVPCRHCRRQTFLVLRRPQQSGCHSPFAAVAQ